MTEPLTWIETHAVIMKMLDKLDRCGYATKVFSRDNYRDVLSILSLESRLQHDHTIKTRIVVQEGIVTVRLRRRRRLE